MVPTYRIKLIFRAGIKKRNTEPRKGNKIKNNNKFEFKKEPNITKTFNLTWRYPDSNWKLFACKANTLPLRYTPRKTTQI